MKNSRVIVENQRNKEGKTIRKHQMLALDGAYEILRFLEHRQQCSVDEIVEHFSPVLRTEKIQSVIDMLKEAWLIDELNDSVRITEDGTEASLLLEVIDGGSLEAAMDRLSLGVRGRFSLITKDITGAFLNILSGVQAKEVLICSPWIRLDAGQRLPLSTLLGRRTRITVITRSPALLRRQEASEAWRSQVLDTIAWLLQQGATVVKHPNVHTKLYIVDAASYSAAIFGSENLTGAANVELGIKITDEVLIKKLIVYWDEVFAQSRIIDEGELIE